MTEFGLALAMMSLVRKKATGQLVVEAGDASLDIEWKGGRAAFATESSPGEPLGRLLVRQGLLTPAQYDAAIDRLSVHVGEASPLRFGETVVELGFLRADDVRKALLDQVRWRIVRWLQLEDVFWHFEPATAGGESTGSITFAVEPLILLATRWTEPERTLRFLIPQMGHAPRLTADVALVTFMFDLEGDEAAFVERVDGASSIHALLTSSEGKLDGRALLAALLLTGACTSVTTLESPLSRPRLRPKSVTMKSPFATAPASTGDSGQAPPGAGPRRSTVAGMRKISVRTGETNPPPAPVGGPMRKVSLPGMQRVTIDGSGNANEGPLGQPASPASNPAMRAAEPAGVAPATPVAGPAATGSTAAGATSPSSGISPPTPAAPFAAQRISVPGMRKVSVSAMPRVTIPGNVTGTTTDPRVAAEQAFLTGKRYLQTGNSTSALESFLRATELFGASAEYRLYAQWLEWICGKTTTEHVGALLATASEAVRQDPNLAYPRYVLGRLALASGDRERARPLFQYAAKLDPTLLDAQRYLRLLELRQ